MSSWESRIVGHEKVDPATLKANPLNHRLHPKTQRDVVRDSINEIGFIKSVTVNRLSGLIVDGHERVMQAVESQKENPDLLIDVEFVELTPGEEAKALAVLDASSELAEVDPEQITALLDVADFDDGLLKELAESLKPDDDQIDIDLVDVEPQLDRIDELQEKYKCKTGDVWLIKGKQNHKLMCGDCKDEGNVTRLMDRSNAELMVTDPPYNVEYEGNFIQSGKILKKEQQMWRGGIANDNLNDFDEWLTSVYKCCDNILSEGAAIYIWHPSGEQAKHFWRAWPFDKWHFQVDLVWNKTSLIIARWDYKPQHEPCMYGWKGKNRKWIGPSNEPTVWDIPRQQGASGDARTHPTQKPLECMARPIRNHKANLIYDPFCGSGTTMVAAEQLNRRCYGMEISPKYCAIVLQRMVDLGCQIKLVQS